jgi:crossover junction endodeoxyribonuclease RuvC
MTRTEVRIAGVDPGLYVTGYGVIREARGALELVEAGSVRTDASAPLELRLRQLHEEISAVLSALEPEVVVVEDLYTQYAHPRTAVLMGHARGVVCLAAGQCLAQVVAYPPALVKRSLTGNGNASKEQVGRMVTQLLRLAEPPKPADVTDALALALCHAVPSRRHARAARRRRSDLPPELAERLTEALNR